MVEDIKETDADWKKFKKDMKVEAVEVPQEIKSIDRKDLNLQHFFNDMQLIGLQTKDNSLKKPTFFYGDLSVTNYLLWLILAELMIRNEVK